MYRYVPVYCREEKATYGGGEGGCNSTQFEQEDVGAVLPVENMEIHKTVDKNHAAQEVGHSQAADEMVGGSTPEASGVEDDAQDEEVLQDREGAQGERQHGDGQLLAGVQDHKALHIHEVLPTLYVLLIILKRGQGLVVKLCDVDLIGGNNAQQGIISRSHFFLERITPEGREGELLGIVSQLGCHVAFHVFVLDIVGAHVKEICRDCSESCICEAI